jgi:signal transduction histidine kinase
LKEGGRATANVLVLSTSPGRAEELGAVLDADVLNVSCRQVESPKAAVSALAGQTWHVLIVDFGIPDARALATLGALRAEYAVPIVVVAGSLDRDHLLRLMRAGVDDYVSWEKLGDLPQAVNRLMEKRPSELARLQESSEQLAASVAHELRNPLAVIQTAVYNIRKKRENKRIDKHLAAIDRKIAESNLIISNLLNYSRLKQPTLEQTNLFEVIKQSLAEAGGRSPRPDVTVIQHIDSIRRERFNVDPGQMREVFTNILVNAYQAIGEVGGRITVSARRDSAGKDLLIGFEDTGVGMNEETIRRSLDPFFTTKSKGTGLGLTICGDIVRLHGGSLAIESREGQGTTVTVCLPVR